MVELVELPHRVVVTLDVYGAVQYQVIHRVTCPAEGPQWCRVNVLRYAAKEADWPSVPGAYWAEVVPASRGGLELRFTRIASSHDVITEPVRQGYNLLGPLNAFPDWDAMDQIMELRTEIAHYRRQLSHYVNAEHPPEGDTMIETETEQQSTPIVDGPPWLVLIRGLIVTLTLGGIGAWWLLTWSGWIADLMVSLMTCLTVLMVIGTIGTYAKSRGVDQDDDQDQGDADGTN